MAKESSSTEPLTVLLQRMQNGDPDAANALATAVYEDLRAMARGHLGRDLGPHGARVTIQPTMLASDTFMKLIRQRQDYDNSGHFFALASRLMMRVLLDYHRARSARKRGKAAVHVPLESHHNDLAQARRHSSDDVDIEAFSAALDGLAQLDPRKADVVRYRVLWGLTVPEISRTLEVAVATVERDWVFARTWLAKEIQNPTRS